LELFKVYRIRPARRKRRQVAIYAVASDTAANACTKVKAFRGEPNDIYVANRCLDQIAGITSTFETEAAAREIFDLAEYKHPANCG
jgi:hypothetical protein